MSEWREGDVFRWHYRETPDLGWGDPYWCCSRIARVTANGDLVDTYWNNDSGRRFTREEANANLKLKFIANLNDLEEVSWAKEMYHPDDVVDLSHPNSWGGVYIRKGAQECLQTQLELAEKELARAEGVVEVCRNAVDWLRGRIAEKNKNLG